MGEYVALSKVRAVHAWHAHRMCVFSACACVWHEYAARSPRGRSHTLALTPTLADTFAVTLARTIALTLTTQAPWALNN